MGMVIAERKKIETPPCNSRNGWSSSPPTSMCLGNSDGTLTDTVPVIVPCYNGKSLEIHQELVVNGLSAISIRHPKGNCCEVPANPVSDPLQGREKADVDTDLEESRSKTSKLSNASRDIVKKHSVTGLPACLRENMKRRNSFWNMHRPELSKLTWPHNFISSAMLQEFFHYHLCTHGTFCEPLHAEADRGHVMDEEIHEYALLREGVGCRELVPPMVLPPDEKPMNIVEKSRSVRLNDEDLDPEIMVHKSRAEFCVTIGEYVRKSFLKRSTSHQIPKLGMHLPSRFEALSAKRESFLSKEEINAEELVSSVISNPTGQLSSKNGESAMNKAIVSTGENNGGLSSEEFCNASSSHITPRAKKFQNGGDFTKNSNSKQP